MKKIIIVAALATLGACSKPEPAPEPAATEEAVPANVAADGGPAVGKWKITRPDGTSFNSETRADGTWVDTMADGTTRTGKWVQKSPELFCSTPDEEGAVETCYEEKVDENGVYTSKDPNTGEVSVVERLEG